MNVGNNQSGGPTIDLNVNGNQGPISATAGSAVYLDWNGTATTNVAIPCTTVSTPASAWSIARPLVGIDVPVYPTAATTVYSITCTDSQGRTATDSITVNVGNQSTNEVQISLGAWTNNGSTFVPLTDGQSIPNYDANTNVSVSSLQVSWIANGSYNSGSTVCTLTSSPNVFAGRTLPTVTSAAVTFNPPVGQAVTYTVTCQRSDGVSQSDSKTVTLAQQQSQQPSSFFKVGDRVYVKGANVNARPNPTITSTPAALHLIDDLGTITAGPIVADGYTWWNVDYIIGTDGWTVENYLGLGAVSLNPVSKIFYFNASPATITNGQTTTLSWYANATNCGVFQNASDNTAIGGGYLPGVASVQNPGVTSMTVSPSATWTYTLKCYKDFGSYSQGSPTVSQPITVTVNEGAAPVIYSFTATPVGSAPIRTINLSWSTDATSCRVEQQTDSLGGNMQVTGVSQVIQNGGASGSLQVSPKSSGVFILVCQKNRKSAVKSLPVTAEYTNNDPTTLALRSELSNPSNNPVTVDIKMNNSSGVNGVVPLNGAPLTVDWSSNNATTCYTSEPNMSGLTSPGSMNSIQTPSIYPRLELPFTYTVTCRGRVGPYVEGQFYYVSASDTLTARVGQ